MLASQFINEEFAHRAGLPDAQIGLGDAYEIDPGPRGRLPLSRSRRRSWRAQIFPNAPLKYMPPTKHMTGDVFKGHLIDAMFNLTSVMTGQTIHLCGMLTEADPHAVLRRSRAFARERALHHEHGASLRRRDRAASRRNDRAPRATRVLSDCEIAARARRRDGTDARHRSERLRRRFAIAGRRTRIRRRLRARDDYYNPFEDALHPARPEPSSAERER